MPAIKCLQFCIIFAYYFAPRAHAATNFSAANSNQYSSAFIKPKAVSYFYHHTTSRAPTLQKIFATTPSSGTPHTHVIAATAPCCHTHIMSTMESIQFARFVHQPFCSLACRIIFCKKRLVIGYKNQTHSRYRINLPSPPSWTHHLPHSILHHLAKRTNHLPLNMLRLLFRQISSTAAWRH